MPSLDSIEYWAWLAACPLDASYYGQIILTVRGGQVTEVEQRQTFRRPRQKPKPPGDGEERSRQSTPHT